jgi:eukaryotic-like serine/threonine-protein kinase
MPLDEALKVATGVADALDKAHGQGVTHRDLKPGNIMLTPTGAKLLDFGLAKLQQQARATASGSAIPAAGPNTTAPGMVLGTMQYMSPEQLEGKEADARTDIFAFGAVLYEMLTGRKAFEGKSQPHLIAAIVSATPEPISKTQPSTPPALDFLVKRCLAKDPEQRLQTATDLVWELEWIAGGSAETGASSPRGVRREGARIARLALAAVTLLVVAMSAIALTSPEGVAPRADTRFLIDVPDMPVAEAVAVSPDGETIAYSASDAGSTAVFIRPINSTAAQKLAGTQGAGRVFWSPDSRWIGFFAGGRLRKVEAAGGPPQNICETPDLLGGTWNADGVILFASSKGLQRVLAAGGQPAPIHTSQESAPQNPQEPFFLPDGERYLYLAGAGSDAAIYAGSLDSTDATRLVASQSNAVYVHPGFLLFHREGTLYAQAFDPSDLELSGEAIRVADGLPYGENGAAAFSASHTGVLAYRNDPQLGAGASAPAVAGIADRPLRWVGRTGTGEQAATPGGWSGPDLSPDGKRAAVHRHDPDGGDVWIFETGSPTPSRFTFDAAQDNSSPVWSPDGARIAFSSRRNAKWGLYIKQADNTRDEELLIETEHPAAAMSWSGERLVYWTSDAKTGGDIWSIAVGTAAGDRKPIPFAQSRADERNPQVSPDGRWIAYSSNETGRSEIYIRPFPEGPGRIQVSVNGGLFPRWRRDGRELYFMSLVSLGSMMASDIQVTGTTIQRQVPRALFQSVFVSSVHAGGQHHAYAATADGQRFLIPQFETIAAGFGRGGAPGVNNAIASVIAAVTADRRAVTGPSSQSTSPITVVLDWTAALPQ